MIKSKLCEQFWLKLFLLLAILLGQLSISIVQANTSDGRLAEQENIAVSGVILDEMRLPLIGVTVVEKGTTNGTITDLDGAFKLQVPKNATLAISYLGYKTQEVTVPQDGEVVVVLKEEASLLDEVIVVGYSKQKKGTIAAAVSSIKSDDLTRSTSTTTAGALVGKISGVTARQKSGTPGSSTSLQIRNLGAPLYVIDGIMKDEGAFNNLDINDIEQISVLKDGAAAIYGVKAANGVVLITTKTGKKSSKPQVNINSYMGWQSWTKYPDLLNAYEWKYANYMKDVNSGRLTSPADVQHAQAELDKWREGYYDPSTGADYRGYDWKDAFVNKAAPQYYVNASVSGGGETTDYYVSISHVDQDAVFKDYNFNRTNLQANFNFNVTKDLKIGYQNLSNFNSKKNPALAGDNDYDQILSSLFNLIPTRRPYANDNPDYLQNMVGHDNARNMAAYTIGNAGKYSQKWRTTQNTLNLEYKSPLEGLVGKGQVSYYYASNNTSDFEKGWKEYDYDYTNKEYVEKYDGTAEGNTRLRKVKEYIEEITGQFTLNYENTFAKKHHVTGVAGFEFYKRDWERLGVSQKPVDNTFVDLIGTNKNNIVENSAATYTTASLIFRAGYSYDSKYIIDFAGRYDASWRFKEGNQWGFFPSISGAWRVSEESFFKDSSVSSWMSNVKLRASYGQMGDDVLGGLYPDFAYLEGYKYSPNFNNGALITTNPLKGNENNPTLGSKYKGIPITDLSWMKIKMMNIGLDLGFFKDKLYMEVDLFKRIRDGIAARPDDIHFPLESGISAHPQNLNSDETMGVDAMIKWNDRVGDVTYFVSGNVTLARQKNGKRYGELFFNAWDKYRWAQNDRWANVASGEIWMWNTIGVFKTQDEIDNYPVNIDGANNTTLVPGDLIFEDVNGDGLIDGNDERPLGYAAADWPWDSSKGNKNPLATMGLSFGAEWKGIDFAADFAGGFMNTFVPDWHVKYGVSGNQAGYKYNAQDVWRHEDIFDPTSPWIEGKFPTLRDNNPSIRWWNNYYTKDVNYLRLRNLVVGYTLPKKWTQKALVERFRVYFEGTNLFSWDSLNDFGFDPEISTVTGFDYPQHKVYTVGVNITF